MILVPESAGAVVDRMTILQIKASRCANISLPQQELAAVRKRFEAQIRLCSKLDQLRKALLVSNVGQWDLEDQIREVTGQVMAPGHDQLPPAEQLHSLRRLAELIRALHISNYKRGELKAEIDKLYGDTPEVKNYAAEESYASGAAGPNGWDAAYP